MAISSAQSVRDNWIEAASDGVVTNAELHAIYTAARASGISTQDLLSAAKTTSIAVDAVRNASRAERAAQTLLDTEKGRAERCLVDGLRKPCAEISAGAEAAEGRRDRAEKRLFAAEDNLPQARKLQKLLRDEHDAQGFLAQLYADLSDL